MESSHSPIVVIVGPTGSGKTALSISLAEKFNGEIICADSRTVYRYLDIGTAKPTSEERRRVRHHLVDILDPDEHFSAADFQKEAKRLIKDIRDRGKVPFVVGGTGLYIDSLLFDYDFTTKSSPRLRAQFEVMTVESLINYCINNNIELPENQKNKRYLIRAIEQKGINRQRNKVINSTMYAVGITTIKEELLLRIKERAEGIFSKSVVEEASKTARIFGWDNESMTGNIYPLLQQVLNQTISVDEAKKKFVTLDWRLAKRQMTWFKRNPYIRWLTYREAYEAISGILHRHQL